jgi:cell division protein ZapA
VSADPSRVSVRILEKEYQFACPAEERNDLIRSAEYLNAKMKQIRDGGRVVGLDRIAIMAALNLANDILKVRSTDETLEASVGLRLKALRERVESALEDGKQLEL